MTPVIPLLASMSLKRLKLPAHVCSTALAHNPFYTTEVYRLTMCFTYEGSLLRAWECAQRRSAHELQGTC